MRKALARNASAVARGGFWGGDAVPFTFRTLQRRRLIQLTAQLDFVVQSIGLES
jgi:hypothetical protein